MLGLSVHCALQGLHQCVLVIYLNPSDLTLVERTMKVKL